MITNLDHDDDSINENIIDVFESNDYSDGDVDNDVMDDAKSYVDGGSYDDGDGLTSMYSTDFWTCCLNTTFLFSFLLALSSSSPT